jgi:hypothetical protein
VERWKTRASDLAHIRYRALDTLGGFVDSLPDLEQSGANEHDAAHWGAYADDPVCAAALRIQEQIDALEEGARTLADEAEALYELFIPEARRTGAYTPKKA